MTHRMFYLLFFETFERTEMTRKVFYIDFSEVFERNQMYRKMFYIYFFHACENFSHKQNVLSFIPSGSYMTVKYFGDRFRKPVQNGDVKILVTNGRLRLTEYQSCHRFLTQRETKQNFLSPFVMALVPLPRHRKNNFTEVFSDAAVEN